MIIVVVVIINYHRFFLFADFSRDVFDDNRLYCKLLTTARDLTVFIF